MTMSPRLLGVAILILRAALTPVTAEFPFYIPIGSLFHNSDNETRHAYYLAVQDINSNDEVLTDYKLAIRAQEVPQFAVFPAEQYVCEMLETGVAAVLGPSGAHIARHVESMLDHKEVPHLNGRWDEKDSVGSFQVNLHPYPGTLQEALIDLVFELDWTTYTIIYDEYTSLQKLSMLLQMYDSKGPTINVRQLPDGYNYRSLFLDLKAMGETRFILECSADILYEVLKQMQQVGLMGSRQNFIITSLDLWTIDLEPFQYGGTNITGFRIINPDDEEVRAVTAQLNYEPAIGREPGTIRLHSALMYDSIKLLASALQTFQHPLLSLRGLNCNGLDSWEHGASLINYLRMTEIKGLTGNVRFDNNGFRSQIELDVVELSEEGLRAVGSWRSLEGINITRLHAPPPQEPKRVDSVFNKTLIVQIALTKPYNMLKEDTSKLTGNDRFEGFTIDLIHQLSLMLNFSYTFVVQEDGDYGSYNATTKQWTGMTRELLDKRADLAVTDLTITAEREGSIDFTNPFMNLGISILYKKPQKLPPSLFSFMSPFSMGVWLLMILAYVGVSLLLFAMARITPQEWNNPYPCIEEPDELINQFSLKNAFWFTLGAIMQQGTEIAAIAVSTRMVSSIWWFFTMIMVSSYTANLAAFLTVESLSTPIRNVEDLANQKVIKYGAKRGGSTANFFRDSTHPTYNKMWNQMQQWGDVFTKDNDEGLLKVQTENYAFFMESTSIEYITERSCDVTQIGGLLDAKSYGIAMQKHSPYRNALSAGVLKMAELGMLLQMKTKWWKQKRGGGACMDGEGANEVSELDLDNVGGVFVCLVVGCLLAVVACVCELLWTVHKICKKDGVQFKEEVMAHLIFAARGGSTKPAKMSAPLNSDNPNRSDASLNGGGNVLTAIAEGPSDRRGGFRDDCDAYSFRPIAPAT